MLKNQLLEVLPRRQGRSGWFGTERQTLNERFASYIEGLVSVIGHRDRAGPLRDYCVGLVMPGARKSVEPMAALTAPERTAAQHQSLLHFVGQVRRSDEKVLAKVREMVLPRIERAAPIEAWIVDDTSFPKQGRHSVGVAHQYCGQLGKKANCQVAVSLSIVNRQASLPVAYRPGPAPRKGRRREPDALSVKEVAVGLSRKAWRTITWREGTNEWLSSRFARLRICVASRDGEKSSKEWLLIQ